MPGINIHEHANVQNGIAVDGSNNLIVPCGTAQTVFCHVTATTNLAGVWEGTYAQFPSTSEADADWFDIPALKIDDAAVSENLPAGAITPDDDDVMAVTTMGAIVVRFRRTAGSGTVSFSVSNSNIAEILAASAGGSVITLKNIDLTLSLETAQYVANDLFEDTRTLTDAVGVVDAPGYLVKIVVTDEQDQAAAAMEVVLMDQTSTVGTQGIAVAISKELSRNILGIVKIEASNWVDIGAEKVATLTFQNSILPLTVSPASGTRNVGVAFITRGTPTNLADGVRARFSFQDAKGR